MSEKEAKRLLVGKVIIIKGVTGGGGGKRRYCHERKQSTGTDEQMLNFHSSDPNPPSREPSLSLLTVGVVMKPTILLYVTKLSAKVKLP